MKSWKVLLIGGSSGVGKSHLARQLSDYYKVPLLELDDIRIALQQVVKETDHPDLFTFINTKNFYEKFNDQEFVLNLLGVGAVVWKALDVLISKHIACDEPIIIEGDGIIPKLLFQRNQDYIKSIFLHDSIDSIKERQLKRDRLGGEAEKAEKNSQFSFAYSEELKRQSQECNFLVLEVSPLDTLFERSLSVLNQ